MSLQEWATFFGIFSVIVGIIITPIIKLNNSITKLTVLMEGFGEAVQEHKDEIKQIWKKLGIHSETIAKMKGGAE